MANDPPTTLKMGFGYKQARAAGLGGIRKMRSVKEINKLLAASKAIRRRVPGDDTPDSTWRQEGPKGINPAPMPQSKGVPPARQHVLDVIEYHKHEQSLEYLQYRVEKHLQALLKKS